MKSEIKPANKKLDIKKSPKIFKIYETKKKQYTNVRIHIRVADFATLHLLNLLEVLGHSGVVLWPHRAEIHDDPYPKTIHKESFLVKGYLNKFVKHKQYNTLVFIYFFISLLVIDLHAFGGES
jgi:hypothetical protein